MRDLYQAFEDSRRLSRQRGFTLIELLVVVAIIAILAAIAIPQFNKYRVNAAKKACLADVRNVVTMCAADIAEDPFNEDCSDYIGYNTSNVLISSVTVSGDNVTIKGSCQGAASGTTITCSSSGGSIRCE